jgi:predicted nucleic acid-binding protein
LAESADVAIGVTAAVHEAVLLTRNARDFARIPGLRLETAAGR